MNRTVQITYYLGLLFAFSYVLIRGFSVGLTHDEALTYKIIRGDEVLKATANHHWLNTHLSAITSYLFGAKEFALRLPNMVSFAIFWFFLFRISRTFLNNSATQIALLFLLCGNPFILDFFSLCRGYGLSVSFITASLFFVFRIVDLKNNSKAIHYFSGVIFAILALSANLNTLNYFLIVLPFMCLCALAFKPKNWVILLTGLILFGATSLYFSLDQLFFLKNKDELYFGTENIHTTIDSLICSSFYSINGFKEVFILRYLLYGLFLFTGFLVIRKRKLYTPGSLAFLLLVGIFSALITEHLLFDSLYPINRSSIYLYPILLLAFLLNIEPLKIKAVRVLILAGSLLFVVLNVPAYNFKRTMTWAEDSCIKEAMLFIKRDIKDKSMHTAECTWIYEPVINYYRIEYDVPIQEVFRDGFKYDAEYLLIYHELVINEKYENLIGHFRECGLSVYKRLPSAAN